MYSHDSNIIDRGHKFMHKKLMTWSALTVLVTLVIAADPLNLFEFESEISLYNSSDKVCELSAENFDSTVLLQNHSTLVDFYVSYCGYCQEYAIDYKKLAKQIYPWRTVLLTCAINCDALSNIGICRQYKIDSYPTLRYFGPHYRGVAEDNYGSSIEIEDIEDIRFDLAQLLAEENHSTTALIKHWPNLKPLTEAETRNLFEGLDNQRQFVVVVYDPENSTIGIETILHFLRWPSIRVRRVSDLSVAAKLKINYQKHKFAIVNRIGNITPYAVSSHTLTAYIQIISEFLDAQHFTELPEVTTQPVTIRATDALQVEIINQVKRNKHFVYQADLEMAIQNILYNEIPRKSGINGESLSALQHFLATLKTYNPLGMKGRAMITKLFDYVLQFNDRLDVRNYEDQLKLLETKFNPMFSANLYVGCIGSNPDLRGFPCSVWQLFHFMSVQLAENIGDSQPLDVLQAMHGYMKFFFGCSNCSEHFQSMVEQRNMWSVSNADEAILWLWEAHNEVNQRLAGGLTEDPQFPKIQFPSQSSCPQCYKKSVSSKIAAEISWDKENVLRFLKNIHNRSSVSRYRDEHVNISKISQKHMIVNAFSIMNLKIKILLCGFCLLIVIISYKLFVCKCYGKKQYFYKFLVKVFKF